MSTKQPKLIPADKKRCQAERKNTFMTLGGKVGDKPIRCTNAPKFIATETQPASDGRIGSMSLCAECAKVMIAQCGAGFATLKEMT